MLLIKSESNQKIVALRYERNEEARQVENVNNNEQSKEIFSENLLWALNECENNDFSVDDRTALDDVPTPRPQTVRLRPGTVKSGPSSRQYVVYSRFPLLVNDYFHDFKNAKLVKNLCLLQDYQISFSMEKMQQFYSNLIKNYCRLLDSYDSLL